LRVSAPTTLRLSVLDQSVAVAGLGEDAAIRDTLDLAQHCERLGYARFWLSEHHGLPTIVGSAPEILMAAIAARTSRIRIGSAGVMLPHYSALKVAEQFRVLEALAPGRIDLGVGRAPGGDMRTARALNPNAYAAAEAFPEQVRDLQAWTAAGTHLGITAHPLGPSAPEIWILGSSDYGAQLAAHFGLPYAFAYFFTDGQGTAEALGIYRQVYKPSPRHPRPQATLCIWALVAETREEAEHHALSRERWRIDRARGVYGPLQAPDDIAARGFSVAEMSTLQPMRAKAFVGSAAEVAEKMRRLAAHFELDELVVNTWAHDPAVRRRSYALLAREFGLEAAVDSSGAGAART
jgi:luciferase family oxidoreductase group 1